MSVSRRVFLQGGLTALGAVFSGCASQLPARHARVALQLWSVREVVKEWGLAKTLRVIRQIGYRGVEFAPGTAVDFHGFKASELKTMLSDSDLVPCGVHLARTDLLGDALERTLEYNLAIGNSFLCCPGGGMLPASDYKGTRNDWWKFVTEQYAVAAEMANRWGARLGYHNHAWEFAEQTHGSSLWDYLFANTPMNFCMQLDVGWAVAAREDPTRWFKRYPHRSWSFHAQEHGSYEKGAKFRGVLGEPGEDSHARAVQGVDWLVLFPVTEADGVEWCVVECEKDTHRLDAVRASFNFLRSLGKC